jgi:HK97 family phage major capsid protein
MSDLFNISKALDTTAGSTGAVLIPELISPGIREFFEKRTPLWNQIRKVDYNGLAYVYKEQTGVPVASFGAELGALPAAQNATYVERAVALKSIYSRGEVSGQVQVAAQTFVDALGREIQNHAIGVSNTLEQKLVTGDATTNPNEFDGIMKWVTNTLFVDSTGDGLGTDAPLSLSHLEQLFDTPTQETPNLLIMNAATRRRLWDVLEPMRRFVGETTIDGGFTVRAYNGVPIIEVKQNPAALDGTILAVNTNYMFIPVAQPLTYEELAHTRDSTDFMIKMYLGLIVEGGAAVHAKLQGFSLEDA